MFPSISSNKHYSLQHPGTMLFPAGSTFYLKLTTLPANRLLELRPFCTHKRPHCTFLYNARDNMYYLDIIVGSCMTIHIFVLIHFNFLSMEGQILYQEKACYCIPSTQAQLGVSNCHEHATNYLIDVFLCVTCYVCLFDRYGRTHSTAKHQ